MSTNWGSVIDVSEVQKASRGATVQLDQSLLDFLCEALSAGQAAALTAYRVDPKIFSSEKDMANEKQRIGAVIRRHVNNLRHDGLIAEGKVSIHWHPEGGYPQVQLLSYS